MSVQYAYNGQPKEVSIAAGWGHVPASTPTRLILPFYKSTCCENGGGGLVPRGNTSVSMPTELVRAGARPDAWAASMAKLDVVQSSMYGGCCDLMLVLTIVGTICVCVNKRNYDAQIRDWIRQLNSDCLEPCGLFGKLQTVTIVHTYVVNDKVEVREEERSWLAISLTRDDAESLRAAPAFYRPTCCQPKIHADPCAGSKCCCCQASKAV